MAETVRDKTPRQLERHLKGLAHHRRIEILLLLQKKPGGLTLTDIAERTKTDERNISHHAAKLQNAGLLNKKYHGRTVVHSLSPYGLKFIKFLTTFSHS